MNSNQSPSTSKVAAILSLAAIFIPWNFTRADPTEGGAETRLHIPTVSGEPGEEITIEFWADLSEAINGIDIKFNISEEMVEFLRPDVSGTASAHVPPQRVIYDRNYHFNDYHGYLAGVVFSTVTGFDSIGPGTGLLILKTIFRIKANAVPGEYPIQVQYVGFSRICGGNLRVRKEIGSIEVIPPNGPRPPHNLNCSQEVNVVRLTWELTESYDSILIRRAGGNTEILEGSITTFIDRPQPGPAAYRLKAIRNGMESLTANCDLLVLEPKPKEVSDLTCTREDGAVSLSWSNGEKYDSIGIFRNGKKISELPGNSQSTIDPFSSSVFTIYTVQPQAEGLESIPASCRLNESDSTYQYWAEVVRAEPGAEDVPIRIFATNPQEAQGLSIVLRIDPASVRIRDLTIEGTQSEAIGPDLFIYQENILDEGVIKVALCFDVLPPFTGIFPPGVDQHVLTILVDILSEVSEGIRVPVEFGFFGNPPMPNTFTIKPENSPQKREAETSPGAILIGQSPLPGVLGAQAKMAVETPMDTAGGGSVQTNADGILLRWMNPAEYSSISIHRNGKLIDEIPGDRTSYLDPHPGPGIHRYWIMAGQGEQVSFPSVVTALPTNVPGTFLRGDANSDGAVDLSDIIALVSYLSLGDSQPSCLDAADADDSGKIELTDAITIIFSLFGGEGPLPTPGPERPWFDPTPDELPCGN